MDVVHPQYAAGCLTDVLPSVVAALGVPEAPDVLGLSDRLSGVRRVALLLVDGLGTRQLPLAAPHAPTLADLDGSLELTAGFPSTTPVSLVGLGTGAAPGAHGVIGFTVNVPGTDRVLNHIEWRDDPPPTSWQPVRTWFERAAAAGVPVSAVSRPEFAGSGLTVAAYRGAEYRGASDVDAVAARMLDALTETAGPALVFGYHPDVDKAGHLFGVDSPQWRTEVAAVDRLLTQLVEGLPPDSALLVTADHGQLNVPAERRVDLAADPRLRAGIRVVAGEPRVRYLHTVPGACHDVLAAWRSVLGERAWVVERDEAVAAGWFGPVPEAHLQRIGDVVVACHDDVAVLSTRTDPPLVAALIAYHGSYTADEMLIPLLVRRSG